MDHNMMAHCQHVSRRIQGSRASSQSAHCQLLETRAHSRGFDAVGSLPTITLTKTCWLTAKHTHTHSMAALAAVGKRRWKVDDDATVVIHYYHAHTHAKEDCRRWMADNVRAGPLPARTHTTMTMKLRWLTANMQRWNATLGADAKNKLRFTQWRASPKQLLS